MPSKSHLTRIVVATLLLILPLASIPANAAQPIPRHPIDSEGLIQNLPGIKIPYPEYQCLLYDTARSLIASAVFTQFSGVSRDAAYTSLRVADMLSAVAQGGDLSEIRREYQGYLLKALVYTVSGNPVFTKQVKIECESIRVQGRLGSIALTLALANPSIEGFVTLLPIDDEVKFYVKKGENWEYRDVRAGSRIAEERIKFDEILPQEEPEAGNDVLRGSIGAEDRSLQEIVSSQSIKAGASVAAVPRVDIRGQIEKILGTIIPGRASAGDSKDGGAPPPLAAPLALGEAVADIVIDYRLLAGLASVLGEDVMGLEGGSVKVGLYTPVTPRGEVNASFKAPLAFMVLTLAAMIAYVRRDMLYKALYSIGLRSGPPKHPIAECYSEALGMLEKKGLGRMPWETPREHLERIKEILDERGYEAMNYVVTLYEVYAYSDREPDPLEASACFSSLEVLKE
ncbi:MAG: DUF4129 domain-containing protein [Desulfurococcales archaeon]|nr:DUF4129 domain-containing protein [Desulfurococcales archaeon]